MQCFITLWLMGGSRWCPYPCAYVCVCLLQTNRIARILAGSKKKICTKKPRFMSACAQLIIAFLLILLQLGIIVALFLMEPPQVGAPRSGG